MRPVSVKRPDRLLNNARGFKVRRSWREFERPAESDGDLLLQWEPDGTSPLLAHQVDGHDGCPALHSQEACTTLERDGPTDTHLSKALLDESLAISTEHGMPPLQQRVSRLRERAEAQSTCERPEPSALA